MIEYSGLHCMKFRKCLVSDVRVLVDECATQETGCWTGSGTCAWLCGRKWGLELHVANWMQPLLSVGYRNHKHLTIRLHAGQCSSSATTAEDRDRKSNLQFVRGVWLLVCKQQVVASQCRFFAPSSPMDVDNVSLDRVECMRCLSSSGVETVRLRSNFWLVATQHGAFVIGL